VEVAYEPWILLRVVDVAGAFASRPCLVEASGQRLTLELTDEAAPWNAGVWRLEAEGGRTQARQPCSTASSAPARPLAVGY
jgi:predicted acetyltransferase